MTIETLDFITKQCFRVNDFLQGMFKAIEIKLVDFKLEFGRDKKRRKWIDGSQKSL